MEISGYGWKWLDIAGNGWTCAEFCSYCTGLQNTGEFAWLEDSNPKLACTNKQAPTRSRIDTYYCLATYLNNQIRMGSNGHLFFDKWWQISASWYKKALIFLTFSSAYKFWPLVKTNMFKLKFILKYWLTVLIYISNL